MKVAMFPRSPWWRANPYLGLLESGLRQHGVACADDPNDGLSWGWLLAQRGQVQVLHFHWLEYHYDRAGQLASALAFVLFMAKLVLARGLGYRIAWTVHNLQPHEPKHPKPRPRLLVGDGTAGAHRHHPLRGHPSPTHPALRPPHDAHIHVLPHPNYTSSYASPPSCEAARQQLGLAHAHRVYLYFGAVRPYKGIEEAIAAFGQVADPQARLLIVGQPLNDEIRARIQALADKDARVQTVFEYVPDEQLPTYYAAADMVVLPFRNVTTSGSAILAMSLGKPVLTASLGLFARTG
ncbi:MAG: glycosyltransferase [Anaerolineae bacterium]|nr:glycosyltransferase [Anaerolineae bacterium]